MIDSYEVKEDLLTINKYSRPGKKLGKVNGIVIHWVANPNTTAKQNRDFFERRKEGNDDYGSAHEIIDLDGSILICIPADEVSYNCGSKSYRPESLKHFGSYPNYHTYSIECTHMDWEGEMTDATYQTLVDRVAFLMQYFNLVGTKNSLWLHHEVVGWKDCHRWFVKYPDKWQKFKDEVEKRCSVMGTLELNHDWQWEALLSSIRKLRKEGVLNSNEWEEKIQARTISIHELAWLNTIIMQRALTERSL